MVVVSLMALVVGSILKNNPNCGLIGGDWIHLLDGAFPHDSTVLGLEAACNLMMQAWQREMIIQVQLY